jgi:iron(II)-dependent oxidoreductase
VADARSRSLALISDLSDAELLGPRLAITNPLLWEIGHVAWFQEFWVLRHALGAKPIREDADALYDSIRVAHDTRWDLPLPSREQTLAYVRAVCDRVLEHLGRGDPDPRERYFVLLSVFHEDMHAEAFTYTRQTLGYAAPAGLSGPSVGRTMPPVTPPQPVEVRAEGDALVPGGVFELGSRPEEPFVFDNEKWAHRVRVEPFAMARRAVSQGEFARFVEDDGYRRRELWSEEGERWRESVHAEAPGYWRRDGPGCWLRRRFDRWVPLESDLAMVNVCFYEAEAFARWAGRRLPTELEWEVAAAGEPGARAARLGAHKRRFPWGEDAPDELRAQLDARSVDVASVHAYPEGESAFGCRQMIGNVWEWTSSDFLPYPGFTPDPYREYSLPWFGTRKVLRGGCFATQGRLLRNTWRNFFEPWRRDVYAGFRTCA